MTKSVKPYAIVDILLYKELSPSRKQYHRVKSKPLSIPNAYDIQTVVANLVPPGWALASFRVLESNQHEDQRRLHH